MNNDMTKIIRAIPSLYCLKHYNIKGRPLTFHIKDKNYAKKHAHRPWQKQMLDDQHPDKVYRKSRQLGMSELAIMENLWFNDTHGNVKSLFTFPRNKQLQDFVKTRLNPVLESSEYFKEILNKQIDSLNVKQIRESYMMFRSAWGGALGEGIDIDYVGFDEYDRMQDDVEVAFQESLSSSSHGLQRRWSTPTIPGRGVDRLFEKSDQHFYFHKCQSCNHQQIITVEDNIKQYKPDGVDLITESVAEGTYGFVCAKCGRELDRWYNGEWVAKHPSRTSLRGYHISQLNAVWISADKIMERGLKYKSKQLYNNYVIGEPYSAAGIIINDDDILAAERFSDPKTSRAGYSQIVVGIDWGTINYCALIGIKEDGQTDLLNTWEFKDNPNNPLEPVKHIAAVITPYNPNLIIADFGYGADRNALLMQLFKGRVWACKYQTFKAGSQPINRWNETSRIVTVDKTLTVQKMIHTIKGQELGFWRMDTQMQMIAKHLKNVRLMEEEDDNGSVYIIATRVGDDHFSSAINYCLVGKEKLHDPYQQKSKFDYDFL